MANSKDFNGKVALITGSSSGMGEATAIYLSKLGAKVVVTSLKSDIENIKRVAGICQSVSPQGFKALELAADITNDSDVQCLVCSTISEFGQIDILVNNAGALFPTNIGDEKLMPVYERNFKLNTRAPVYLTSLVIPYLEKTKGSIINISSLASIMPIPPNFAYCMSKSAVDMFTKCLAIELGPKGIRVNCINPGGVRSNFGAAAMGSAEAYKAYEEALINSTLVKRYGEPQDIANAIAFLASNDASFITGVSLIVDGGSAYSKVDWN